MTFTAFAHGIMDNCDTPRTSFRGLAGRESGRKLGLRERLKIAGFSFKGMRQFWFYSQEEREFYYGVHQTCHKLIGGKVYCTLQPGHKGRCSHKYTEKEKQIHRALIADDEQEHRA